MASAARRNLRLVTLFGRGLALVLGAVVGGQIFAAGGGPLWAAGAGGAVWLCAHLLVQWLVRRQQSLLSEMEAEREPPLPPRRQSPRRVRRVLTDRSDDGRD